MRKRFIQGAIIAACWAGSAWSGSVVAQTSAQGFPLEPGCQVNVATGGTVIPAQAIQAVIDNGGQALVGNAGTVTQTTLYGWSLFEDDERWVDLRDFEVECRAFVPFAK